MKQTGKKQTKKGIAKDKKRTALKPGKRVSKKTGETYYETRRNRSDRKKKGDGL